MHRYNHAMRRSTSLRTLQLSALALTLGGVLAAQAPPQQTPPPAAAQPAAQQPSRDSQVIRRRIDVVNQRLGYLVRSGDPDALDSIVPMAFGNLALDLILKKEYGRLVSVHKGFYDSVPITSVTSEKKVVDVKKYYNTERLRPIYEFDGAPLFIMTSD